MAVVLDLKRLQSTISQRDSDHCGSSIKAVLDQLLESICWTLYDLQDASSVGKYKLWTAATLTSPAAIRLTTASSRRCRQKRPKPLQHLIPRGRLRSALPTRGRQCEATSQATDLYWTRHEGREVSLVAVEVRCFGLFAGALHLFEIHCVFLRARVQWRLAVHRLLPPFAGSHPRLRCSRLLRTRTHARDFPRMSALRMSDLARDQHQRA